MKKEELIKFEEEIKDLFLAKKIRCPVHLCGGNEDVLIEIFQKVRPEDWVLSTHRSHLHALLKGISPGWLKKEILAGRSMQIMNPEHNFFSSSIVGGNVPIAVGIGMAIKMSGDRRHVWCFTGDMAAESGIFYESVKYSSGHRLPITFVIEDNGFSTDTPTAKVWKVRRPTVPEGDVATIKTWPGGAVLRFCYQRTFPHVGVGAFVHF